MGCAVVLPDAGEHGRSNRQKKKLVNTSLILPRVIREIAAIKGISVGHVEDQIYENTVRVFGLHEKIECLPKKP